MTQSSHRLTVEKIGGTSMSRLTDLRDTLLIGSRKGDALYNRIFVVSAFAGITNLLLEHKKTGEPGVYASFANASEGHGWLTALDRVGEAMRTAHHGVLSHSADLLQADEFVRDRVEGARSCLFDLQRLCSYGHFRLSQHMLVVASCCRVWARRIRPTLPPFCSIGPEWRLAASIFPVGGTNAK